MKKRSLILVGFITLIFVACQKDEVESSQNASNSNTSPSYPVTYSSISFEEFKLWIAGEEIDTQGLNIQDYVSPGVYEDIPTMDDMPAEINLDGDSIFVTNWEGQTFTSPYTASGDSILIDTQLFEGFLFAFETPNSLLIKRGLAFYAEYGEDVVFISSNTAPLHFNFENTTDFHDFENPGQMTESDTLVIFNQTFRYE
jgi:hypothetical protein